MKTILGDLEAGDYVLCVGRNGDCLRKVTRVTAKLIFLGDDRWSKLTGESMSKFESRRIILDPERMRVLEEKAAVEKQAYESRLREVKERDARTTYKLANQIVNPYDTDVSIATLEAIGEDKLNQIIEWINEANK